MSGDHNQYQKSGVVKYSTGRRTMGKPVAWVRNLTDPQPHCVTDLKYMSAADVDAGVCYIPLYAAPHPDLAQVGEVGIWGETTITKTTT